jgi:hypothetical protein
VLVDADKQLGTTRASEVEDDAVREPPSPRRIDLPLRIASKGHFGLAGWRTVLSR